MNAHSIITTFIKHLTIYFFLIILFGGPSSQLFAMEEQLCLSIEDVIWQVGRLKAKQESNLIVSQFNQFMSLNDSLLSEEGLSQTRKEIAATTKEETQKLIKIIEEDQSNLHIYQGFHPIYKCIKQFVTDLDNHSVQEPLLHNHLEGYYTLLGKLTVIDQRINLIRKDMDKLKLHS